jgi:Putative transposase
MTLEADEFIRRFLLHVLSQGLQRIRYGLLGNRHREEKLAQCRQLLKMEPKIPIDPYAEPPDYRDRYQELTGVSLHQCPVCHRVRMQSVHAAI